MNRRTDHPRGRRRTDKIRHLLVAALHVLAGRESWFNALWRIFVTGAVLLALILFAGTIRDQKEGRRFAVDVMCGAVNAVIDGGRATITGGQEVGSPEFVKNLEALGFPPKNVREKQSKVAAASYAQFIAHRVEMESGVHGVVIEKGPQKGTLDCVRLTRLAKAD